MRANVYDKYSDTQIKILKEYLQERFAKKKKLRKFGVVYDIL